MNAETSVVKSERWTYVKIYIGNSLDRLDPLIVKLGSTVPSITGIDSWFYIRYFDEQGIHVRLRLRSSTRSSQSVQEDVQQVCAPLINSLHELLPSTYYPMVVPAEYESAIQEGKVAGGSKDVQIIYDDYVPEAEKFGGSFGVKIAEDVFRTSSDIACCILSDEAQGLYSRKDLIPALMNECFHAFLSPDKEQEFWNEYSYYWLGGKTPAAEDWMQTFCNKGDDLAENGVDVVPAELDMPANKRQCIERWRRSLVEASTKYKDMSEIIDFNREVVCFNFAHLMNNRLGIASLEEAYISALLKMRASQLREKVA